MVTKMEMGYSRHSKIDRITKPVAIVAVSLDLRPPQATGITPTREYVQIDISHFVGAVEVTPAVGEQWMIIRDRSIWKLDQQLPHNIPSTLEPRYEGQTRIGSSGPTELDGSQVNANAPLRAQNTTTAGRPDAKLVSPGSHIYDTTLNKPIWSDGTSWRDAAGTIV
jgi:hypothetical protein